jgi:hypothetical protein
MLSILLTDCAIAAGYVDSTQFEAERDDPVGAYDVDFEAIVSVPTPASTLFFELVELLNCKAWTGEDLKVTIKRNFPNRPGRTYATLSDAASIIEGSAEVDLNLDSRLSKASIYWDRTAVGQEDLPASYARLTSATDSSAESVNEYGTRVEKTFYCRWLRSGYEVEEDMRRFVKNLASRLVAQSRDPMPIITLEVERKDGDSIKTGDYVKLTTDELQDRDGEDLASVPFQVIRREQKDVQRIQMKCQRLSSRRYCFIAPASYAGKAYATATDAEREYGWLSDKDGLMANGDEGYRIL